MYGNSQYQNQNGYNTNRMYGNSGPSIDGRTGPSSQVNSGMANRMNSPYDKNGGRNLNTRNVASFLPPVTVRHPALKKIVTQDMRNTLPKGKLDTLNKLRSLIKRSHDLNGELWDVLPHILHWYFGSNQGRCIYDLIDDQPIPKKRKISNSSLRKDLNSFPFVLPTELSLLSLKGMQGVPVEGSLFFELFCNDNLLYHKSKRKLWFPVNNLPDAIIRSIEDKIAMVNLGGNLAANEEDIPILVDSYVDILQQTPDDEIDLYGSERRLNARGGSHGGNIRSNIGNEQFYGGNSNGPTRLNGSGINSMSGGRVLRNVKRLQVSLEEYYMLTFLLSIVSKGRGRVQMRKTINSPSSYGGLFNSTSRGVGNVQRNRLKKKMYGCLLKYGMVECRQLEPYVELLYQCLRRFLPMPNEDYDYSSNNPFGEDFFIDHVILCWIWPVCKKKEQPFQFTKKLGGSIACIITYVINRDYDQLVHEGNSRTFEALRVHIFNMLFTIIGKDGVNGSTPDEFSIAVDIWLLVLMPWLARDFHNFEGRNLGASNVLNSSSQDALNPLTTKLRQQNYGKHKAGSNISDGSSGEHHHTNSEDCKRSCDDKATPYAFDESKWLPYILANYPFYSVLFDKFVSNILSMDFMSSNNAHLEIVERVIYAFTPHLRDVLRKCSIFIHYNEYYFSNGIDEDVIFSCRRYSEELQNRSFFSPFVGSNSNAMGTGLNGAREPDSLFMRYESNGKGDEIARKLKEVSLRAGQSGSLYVDTIKFLEKEHQPSWNVLGQLDDKGLKQVQEGTRIASNMRWVEKNGQFKWKFDADTNDFVLIDPLDEPLYSYEIPFLTKFFIILSKKMNKWLKYDYKGNDLIDFGLTEVQRNGLKKGNAYASENSSASSRMKTDGNDGKTGDDSSVPALVQFDEESYRNPWGDEFPEFSFYYSALFGSGFLGVKKTITFGNIQERLRRIERMNHDIFMLTSSPPKPFNFGKSKTKLSNGSAEMDGKNKGKKQEKNNVKAKAGKKKKVDPRNLRRCCGATLKFPRYKYRIDLRFLGDIRLYLGLLSLYVTFFFFIVPFYGFLFGDDDAPGARSTREVPQKQIGMSKEQGRIGL